MADSKRDIPLSSEEVFRREAAAEAAQKKLVEESQQNLTERCSECGALGSIEEVDGEMRCVDCDEVVGAQRSLGGMGRA